jgi:signal transduction histidine kinase
MHRFNDLSIRHKLTLLLLAVVGVVLLAVSVVNVVSEVRSTRASLAAKYVTLAKIVAAQSGAALSIADVDASGAQQIVSDLGVETSIRYVALVNAAGNEVARFPADMPVASRPSLPPSLGFTFTGDGFLDVVDEVRLKDAAVGRIYLRATTDQLQRQIQRIILNSAIVCAVALALAYVLSIVLQRFISTPILELAQLTKRVSTQHDYTLSAKHTGKDELGTLCESFNAMLSEIRRRDQELELFNAELLRSNDELRQFAYVASHDLQEPLRSITSFCNLLEAEYRGELDEMAENYLERIVKGAKRMKALVNDLLNYSRVTRDHQAEFQRVDFHNVVDDALANLQSAIGEADAKIIVGELPTVVGDRVQLVQVVQNLIGNAIKYRGDKPPQIRVAAQRRGDGWEFSVEDNGIGIAPEFHQQIFEIFKRLHGREKYPGTGIGLAVCRKIVQRHGGEISVDSRAGAGSIFQFTIHTSTEASIHEPDESFAAPF